MNSECRSCIVQDPMQTIVTFDRTPYPQGDPTCSYSLVQSGLGTAPDSYVGIDVQPGSLDGQITHETLIFKDDGAEAVTCPADDPINGCSFGPMTADPTEIDSSGTLVFTYEIGSLTYSAIMGANGITTLYSQNTLILLAPISSQGDLYGLCGAFNGDGTDDFTTSDGTVTTDQTEFTTSYQIDCPAARADAVHKRHWYKSHGHEACEEETAVAMAEYSEVCHSLAVRASNTPASSFMASSGRKSPPKRDLCVDFLCNCNEEDELDVCLSSMDEIEEVIREIKERSLTPDEIKELLQ
ncbi:uncharacterized protein LOC122261705 [Penaeus japonicus]|uniref:uncharacterized protein LOC122261705 n=1 Tax=Penaeus japonicus TaxID=27405 RepID=UPI001C714FF3|nr:uncharacterized protein LOC122261705 [Penaeus japonicus]